MLLAEKTSTRLERIPLTHEHKLKIVALIADAVTRFASDVLDHHELQFHSSVGWVRRDCLYTKLAVGFKSDPQIKVYICPRPGVTLLLLYQVTEKFLYYVMTGERLAEIKRSSPEERVNHYMPVLSMLNNGYPHPVQQEFEDFGFPDPQVEQERILNDILADINGEVKGSVVITYRMHENQIVSVAAQMYASNLEPVLDVEDWVDFIPDTHFETSGQESNRDGVHDIRKEHIEPQNMGSAHETKKININPKVKLRNLPNLEG